MSSYPLVDFFLLKMLILFCKIIPIRFTYVIFDCFGKISFIMLRKRRLLSLKNLKIAFPEKTISERKKIAKKSFLHLSEMMAFNILVFCNKIKISEVYSSIETEGWNHLKKLIDESNKGVLIITSHIGNWEAMSQYTSMHIPGHLSAIARQSNNKIIENKIINPMRKKFNIEIFHKKNAILKTLKVLKNGKAVTILIDQKLNDPLHVKVDFFNRLAKSTPLPALLQIRYDIPVIHGYMVRLKKGSFKLVYEEQIKWNKNADSEKDQVKQLTQIHQQHIEKIVKLYPEQWFWIHDRWSIKKDL